MNYTDYFQFLMGGQQVTTEAKIYSKLNDCRGMSGARLHEAPLKKQVVYEKKFVCIFTEIGEKNVELLCLISQHNQSIIYQENKLKLAQCTKEIKY